MVIAAGVLLVLGTLLELGALELGRRDLQDAAGAAERRKEEKPRMMAANKYAVDDWITQATRTRTLGIYLFGGGLILQAIGNVLALT